MRVRILGEGQFDVPDEQLDTLNRIDAVLADAVADGDEPRFRQHLANLLDLVRTAGVPVAPEILAPSEVILPGPDASLAEVKALLGEEGLVPG